MNWRKYYKKEYYKLVYYKYEDWTRPNLTSNTTPVSEGNIVASASSTYYESIDANYCPPYKALDGATGGTTTNDNCWFPNNLATAWWKVIFPYKLIISNLVHLNKGYPGQQNIIGRYYADVEKTKPFGPQISTTATSWTQYPITPEVPIITNTIFFEKTGGNGYSGIGELLITAKKLVPGTLESHDYIEKIQGTELDNDGFDAIESDISNFDYFEDTQVPTIGNFIAGRYILGRYIYAQNIKGTSSGGNDTPDDKINWLPGVFTVIAYNKDGTKTAVFGAGAEQNALTSMKFELIETGCGAAELGFNMLPINAELNYKQRFDIHLYGDPRPWYSGYIISRPVKGTTDTSFKFTGHGYYNQLEKLLLFKTYEDIEVAEIVKDIAKEAENKLGLVYNAQKIIKVGYKISKIEFDGVDIKEALKQLLDFAIDYVTGVDERRSIYFKPRDNEIQEKARFWVGKHLNSYSPTWDVDKVVNWARVKGAKIDENGETWLATVEDVESQNKYGMQQAIWTLPTAYSANDAERWGKNQIEQYKEPIKSAKVKGIKLEYPRADGSFFVRKLATDGLASITTLDGEIYNYPITKLKYEISASKGISADMELGEQPFKIDTYFAELERDNKNNELLQNASNKQLKGAN